MIKNAIIKSAELSTSDGLLDCWLTLDYGGSGQGFGGYALYLPKSWRHYKLESPAGHHIFRIMEIAGVTKWSELCGRTIRVRTDSKSEFGGQIEAVGHILNDDWFNPSADYAALKSQQEGGAS
jgi:hypothetical protein